MNYEYRLTNQNMILNFTEHFCETSIELLESDAFRAVLARYYKHIQNKGSTVFMYLTQESTDDKQIINDLSHICKLLLVESVEEIVATHPNYKVYLDNKDTFIAFIEEIYLYWRKLQRYAIVLNNKYHVGYQNVSFIKAQEQFEELVLKTYRDIEEKVNGEKNRIYRQITAGVNAGLILCQSPIKLPLQYQKLEKIPVIESVIIHPPFITYSKSNKRKGVFEEKFEHPLTNAKINANRWYCYPAKVGDLLAYIYFSDKFMAQGVTLCNLFELAKVEEITNHKPDLVYIYGYDDDNVENYFYHDKDNNIMVGYVSNHEDADYFGYMKKMVLTLHNVRKIQDKKLPLHGAMVSIKLYNDEYKRIVIIGDSGAGKSETIEQIKAIGQKNIKEIKTVFDDMGVLEISDGRVVATGTEIGAFVRLDDLDVGYGYKELDRSVFMNPDKINARIVIPIATYKDIVAKYPVDLFLYANNYDESPDSLEFFESTSEALNVFRRGARMAKGTTNEMGIVESYFANPFGPVQKEVETEELLHFYFGKMEEQGIKLGQIKTRLGIKNQEHAGPKEAAKELLTYIIKK